MTQPTLRCGVLIAGKNSRESRNKVVIDSSIDRYVRTLMAFFSMRSDKFVEKINSDPSKYSEPYQFFFYSSLINIALYTPVISSIETLKNILSNTSHLIIALLLLFGLLAVKSFMFYMISKLPPIWGKVNFASTLETMCYLHVTIVPYMVAAPILASLPECQFSTAGKIIGVLGVLWFIFSVFIYYIPAVAYLNKVSICRAALGCFVWSSLFVAFLFAVSVIFHSPNYTIAIP